MNTTESQPQEWTLSYLETLYNDEGLNAVLKAHKAELAAEREKVKTLMGALEGMIKVSSISWDNKGHLAVVRAKAAVAKVKEGTLSGKQGGAGLG